MVEELDRGDLVVLRIDPQHPQPGAVVDRGVLVVLLRSGASDGFDELDVDLDLMARQRLLVAFPAAIVGLVALVGRQPVESETFQNPTDTELEIVIRGSGRGTSRSSRPEVIVLAQVDDLADHVGVRRERAEVRARSTVPRPSSPSVVVSSLPGVEALPADPVVPAGPSDVPVTSSACCRIASRRLACRTSCCSVI